MTEKPRLGKVVVFRDKTGQFRWRAVAAGNNEPLADGGEGYKRKEDAASAAHALFPDANFEDQTNTEE